MNDIERNREPMELGLAQEVIQRLTFHFIKESDKRSMEDTNIILAALGKSINALEKQKPKKAVEIKDKHDFKGNVIFKDGYCPICKNEMSNVYFYCSKCGQAIDWKDDIEDKLRVILSEEEQRIKG
jgi:hypothetical protein